MRSPLLPTPPSRPPPPAVPSCLFVCSAAHHICYQLKPLAKRSALSSSPGPRVDMARTMSPEEYEQLGKRYYKQKQYEKAAAAFTDGIEATASPPLSLFDYRAASYDKLGKYSSAVKDGREMIKMCKQDIRVRPSMAPPSSLLTAAGLSSHRQHPAEDRQARDSRRHLQIRHENGVYCRPQFRGSSNLIYHTHALVQRSPSQVLQKLHDKITRTLSPAEAVDPLTVLPVELVEIIIGYMSFQNMVNCLRVSKAWKNYLIKRPGLWTHLDFSAARKPVAKGFIRDAVFRSEYRITRVTVHRVADLEILVNVATACKSLHTLEFLSGGLMSMTLIDIAQCSASLKKLVVDTDLTLDTITQVLRWRPTLEHAEFKSVISAEEGADWKGPFPNLHTLIIHVNFQKPSLGTVRPLNMTDAMTRLIELTPALVHLELMGCRLRPDVDLLPLPLTHLIYGDRERSSEAFMFPRLPSTLTHFTLRQRGRAASMRDPQNPFSEGWITAVQSHVPNLTHLTFNNLTDMNCLLLSALLDMTVKANQDNASMDSEFETETAQGAPLQHFSVSDCILAISVPSLCGPGGLLTSSPRILTRSLTSLDLSDLPCTDDDIEDLVTHPTSLQIINIGGSKITGASIKMLVDGLPTLKIILADQCAGISGRDAIHYAEQRGVTVSHRLFEQKRGVKRVRYG